MKNTEYEVLLRENVLLQSPALSANISPLKYPLNMKKLTPLLDNVIVKPLEGETMTASGIVIPDTVSKEKPMRGEIIAVGPGKMVEGKLVECPVKEGDIVVFTKYAPTEIKIDNQELYILGFDSLLAVES